jgi:hypothetical protein
MFERDFANRGEIVVGATLHGEVEWLHGVVGGRKDETPGLADRERVVKLGMNDNTTFC